MTQKIWNTLSTELAQSAEEAGRSVVAVLGWRHPASGVLLSRDAIVTVDHAVRHEGVITVVVAPGERVAAHVAGRDSGTDLAVLRLQQPVKAAQPRWSTVFNLRIAE